MYGGDGAMLLMLSIFPACLCGFVIVGWNDWLIAYWCYAIRHCMPYGTMYYYGHDTILLTVACTGSNNLRNSLTGRRSFRW